MCFQVKRDDGLPAFLCNDCTFTLNLFINFKEQCHKSDAQLRKSFYTNPDIYGEYKTVAVLSDNISTGIVELRNESLDIINEPKVVTVDVQSINYELENNENISVEKSDSPIDLLSDQQNVEVKSDENKCTECKRNFKLESSLRNHLLLKHGKKLKCEVCTKEFHCKFVFYYFN